MKEFLRQLFELLGIQARPGMPADDALDLIKQKLEPLTAMLVEEAVDEAMAADTLRPDEREWALDFAGENFAAFRAFLKLRKPIPLAVMALAGRLAEPVVPDALQDSINKKIGVTSEIFAKYDSSRTKDADRIDATQEAINKQVGLSRETYLKYNSPAKAAGV